MTILMTMLMLGLLMVAGFITVELVGEKRDETW